MKKVFGARLLAVMVALIFGFAQAADVALRDDRPQEYIVKKGDTLWDISGMFFEKPWQWPEIWHWNPQVENPHLIFPGDRLFMGLCDGRPCVKIDRGSSGRTVKLTPQARIEPLDSAIPAIPLDAINSFLHGNRIIDPELIESAPYVIAGGEEHIVTGAGDKVYARGELLERLPVYGVFRRGQVYIDPDTGENLGLEVRDIGMAKLEAENDDVLSLMLTSTREEVRLYDRLLSTEGARINSMFYPKAPEHKVRGKLIAVNSGVSQVGRYNVVTINRGEREGITPGTVLAIYRSGIMVRDELTQDQVQLPAERAGMLMVFRTFEKVSYGLVLSSSRPLEILDEVRNP